MAKKSLQIANAQKYIINLLMLISMLVCITVKMFVIFVFIFYIKFSESRFSNGRIPMNSLIELERYVVLRNADSIS